MEARERTSARHVSEALSAASRRVLSHEERLARAATSVLRTTGLVAARRFVERTEASLVAAAGDGGWTPPHENELIDVEATVAALRGKSDPIRRSAIKDYGSTLKRLAPEIDWDVTNPLVGGVLAGAAQHVTNITDTTRLNLMRIVRASYEEGLSIEDTAKAIRAGMSEASKVRGRLIARTEMAAVTNGGSLAATKLLADATGDAYYKRWMTAPGAHYPRHEDYEGLDGQTVALGEDFDVGGTPLQFPGDPDGPPEEICNCRCTLAYVGSADEPLAGEAEPPPEMPSPSDEPGPLAPIDGEAPDELAGVLASNAEAMEPYVTAAVQAATEPLGGYLQGFERRFKTEGSLARKIETDLGARLPGIRPEVAATGVKDSLRYTAVYRPGEYVGKMTKTLDALRAAGIEVERVRPSWARGREYAGTNALLRTQNGFRFELQFHTPQSFHVKEFVNHDAYEAWRLIADKGSPEARALAEKMAAEADRVRRPPGIEGWSYDGSVHADIGLTPFREGVDDPIGFYDTDKYARFQKDTRDLADHFGVTLDGQEKATGVWQGAEEPSVHLQVHDGERGVRAFAAALGRAYRQDGVAIFSADNGDAVIARFSSAASPIPEAAGTSIRDLMTGMGAHELDVSPEFRPDLFKAPRKLKGGGFAQQRNELPAPRVKTRADKSTYGLPPRIEDTVSKTGFDKVVEGSERPPQYLYRAVSEEDYQQALDRGFLQSDQRMNLADEGTVADFTDPSYYLPGKLASDADGVYGGRVLRIRYRDEDGWTLDHDGYAKTKGEIPMTQIDLVTPKIETVRETKANDVPSIETRIVPAAPLDPDAVYAAMERAGLPAGRILPDGTFEVMGEGPEFVRSLDALSRDLGVKYDGYVGNFELLEGAAGDYEKAIGDAQGSGAVQARQAGRNAADLPGGLAVRDGAEVAEAGARPLAPLPAELKPLPRLGGGIPVYRTEAAHAAYKGKAAWGEGRYFALSREEAADLQLDPNSSVVAEPNLDLVDRHVIPSEARLVSLRADDVDTAQAGLEGEELKRKVLAAGYDGVYVITESANLGGDQIVLYREPRIAASSPPGSLKPPPDVSSPPPPTSWRPPYPPSEVARFGPDRLWGARSEIGRLQNEVRRELPELEGDRLVPLLWEKGAGTRKGELGLSDVAGDAQFHTHFSDGHATLETMAEEARLHGEQRIVVSDHSHLLTTSEIEAQHKEIDFLNARYQREGRDFKVLKGIEANILADGSLDVAPEVLARFDVVNAAIHQPIEGSAGQLALFRESNTARLLRALDDPELDVLVHPHSVAADWDAVAKKAAQKGVALEVNGRDLLRNARQESAADMIEAARRHGAKLVLGSDAHTPGDLVDLVYAVRFASRHGVTFDDLAPLARARRVGADASESFPASINTANSEGHQLGGGMNEVWKVETKDGQELVVKPEPDPERLRYEAGVDTDNPLRENIAPGNDLERERAAYVVSRLFNEVGGDEFHVNVPPYRIGEFTRVVDRSEMGVESGEETNKAGIAQFIPGKEGRAVTSWTELVRDHELDSAALYDFVVGNTDRHAGNFIFDDADQNLWLIDHGLTFPTHDDPNQFQNTKLLDERVARHFHLADGRSGDELSEREVEFLRRLQARLPSLEAELRRLLDPREIEAMNARIERLIDSRNFAESVYDESSYGDPYNPDETRPPFSDDDDRGGDPMAGVFD